MKIVCISDTHGLEPKLPEGDMLIHAGDLTPRGKVHELAAATRWLARQKHELKIVIAGNHDHGMQESKLWAGQMRAEEIIYLEDQFAEVNGLSIFGSPWTLPFFDWAFQMDESQMDVMYSLIQDPLDILITHGPPQGILDTTYRGEHVGSQAVLSLVKRLKPKLHVFGHIHEGYGRLVEGETIFVNASHCGMFNDNNPIVVEL